MDKKKILIVDDEAMITRLLQRVLEGAGPYEVRTENDSAKAMPVALAFKPDLILLDLMMPGMDGSEVAARMKENEELRGIPVVFLTGAVSSEEVARTGGLIGEEFFMAKNSSIGEIVKCVKRHL